MSKSLKRWGKKDRFGQLLMAHTGKIAPVDKKTFTLELAERFGPVLDALGKPSSNVPFMMPARIASTPPEEQIKEIVGSGPFKFARDEWQPGEQVVYLRNPDYIPRDETPSGSTGGKKVYVDKVIWRHIPDPWDAADDLAAGKVDWWEQPPLDFIPKIEQNPDLQTFVTDPARDARLAQAELPPPAVQQQEGARGTAPHDGPSDISCIGPSDSRNITGLAIRYLPAAALTRRGSVPSRSWSTTSTRARQLVKESGYDGRPIVVLHVTDVPFINAAAIVTRQRLESIGFKVILKAMDWSTNLVVRARKEPPDKGGWNLLHTWWLAADVSNPAVHFGVSGAGARAWFGWPDIPQLEKLVTDWVRATDQTKREAARRRGPEGRSQRSARTCRGENGSSRRPSERTSGTSSSSERRFSGT